MKNKFENEEKDSQTGNGDEGGGMAVVKSVVQYSGLKKQQDSLSKSHAAATHSFVV